MKLTENIILTKHHFAPAGSPIDRYSISDKPVSNLIKNLCEQDVKINSNYSEKEISYLAQTEQESDKERIVKIPLLTKLPDATPIAFYLRSESGLELELRDYSDITQRPSRGVIGGTIAGSFGIICKLSAEGETTDLSVVEKVKKALEKTYGVKTNDFLMKKINFNHNSKKFLTLGRNPSREIL